MRFVKEADARAAARRALAKRHYAESADRIFKSQTDPLIRRYDIFLSHSIHDAELVLGAKQLLEEKGKTVYVDWIDDPLLHRSRVCAETARVLRLRMQHCASLVYTHSTNSGQSKWMPWELGYFDGHNGNVAIFPILKDWENTFVGQEYLGIYPCIEIDNPGREEAGGVWLYKSQREFMALSRWQSGDRTWMSS